MDADVEGAGRVIIGVIDEASLDGGTLLEGLPTPPEMGIDRDEEAAEGPP